MEIIINGKAKEFDGPVTLSEIVTKFCKQPQYIVSAVNGEIVSAKERETIVLREGDEIELITPVGGG